MSKIELVKGRTYTGKIRRPLYKYHGRRGARHIFVSMNSELRLLDSQLPDYLLNFFGEYFTWDFDHEEVIDEESDS